MSMVDRKLAFRADIRRAVKDTIKRLKLGGTVAMGVENLWQVTVTQVAKSPFGPTGANCAAEAWQEFQTVCREPEILRFVLQ